MLHNTYFLLCIQRMRTKRKPLFFRTFVIWSTDLCTTPFTVVHGHCSYILKCVCVLCSGTTRQKLFILLQLNGNLKQNKKLRRIRFSFINIRTSTSFIGFANHWFNQPFVSIIVSFCFVFCFEFFNSVIQCSFNKINYGRVFVSINATKTAANCSIKM